MQIDPERPYDPGCIDAADRDPNAKAPTRAILTEQRGCRAADMENIVVNTSSQHMNNPDTCICVASVPSHGKRGGVRIRAHPVTVISMQRFL